MSIRDLLRRLERLSPAPVGPPLGERQAKARCREIEAKVGRLLAGDMSRLSRAVALDRLRRMTVLEGEAARLRRSMRTAAEVAAELEAGARRAAELRAMTLDELGVLYLQMVAKPERPSPRSRLMGRAIAGASLAELSGLYSDAIRAQSCGPHAMVERPIAAARKTTLLVVGTASRAMSGGNTRRGDRGHPCQGWRSAPAPTAKVGSKLRRGRLPARNVI